MTQSYCVVFQLTTLLIDEVAMRSNSNLGAAARLFCAVIGIAALTGPGVSQAAETFWMHNGSKIRWVSDGNLRRAYYVEPRPGLDKLGVYPGQLLFEGHRRGYVVEGRAFTFKQGCPPLSFHVSASLTSETMIDLKGAAPKRRSGCETTSTVDTTLRFDYVATTVAGQPTEAPGPQGGPYVPPPAGGDTPEACKKFPLLCN